MTISCATCPARDQACTFLLHSESEQSLCLQAKGWLLRGTARNWYCLSCRKVKFPHDMRLPDPATLPDHCLRHLWTSDDILRSYRSVDGIGGGTSSSSPAAPPPPPPTSSPSSATGAFLCRDRLCHASLRACSLCLTLQDQIAPQLTAIPNADEYRVAHMVSSLCVTLNNTPTSCFPSWVLSPTTSVAREAHHVAELRWDECGNLAGSVLMLIMLRPLVLGMPWHAPLRIFGFPPPASLLELDGPTSIRRPHDNHRANCVEGLLGHFRCVGDHVRGDLLQDCWYLIRTAIFEQNWITLTSWQITRLSLNHQASTAILPGIAQTHP